MESPSRSITKAIIWQITGLVSMSLVGLAVTGSIRVGGVMALVNAGIGLVAYLVYERIWSKISWGRSGDPVVAKVT